MLIKKEKFKRIVENLQKFIEEKKLLSLSDLEKIINQKFQVNRKTRELVQVTLRPSNFGTFTYTISYIWEGAGIPIEAKINPFLDYTQMLAKLHGELPNYSRWGEDPFGNILYNKLIEKASIQTVLDELKKLR